MVDLSFYFKEKYRIPSTRLKNWDYSSVGWYFVTICTYQKKCWFGQVNNGRMFLNQIGKIVQEEWLKTKQIRKNIDLDEFVVMPNHLHGIIIIKYRIKNKNSVIKNKNIVDTSKNKNIVETSRRDVSTENKNLLKPNSLGSIICQFKSITTKRIHQLAYYHFHWQSRFYDHIIRSEQSLNEIRQYIRFNPLKWEEEEENPKNFKIC